MPVPSFPVHFRSTNPSSRVPFLFSVHWHVQPSLSLFITSPSSSSPAIHVILPSLHHFPVASCIYFVHPLVFPIPSFLHSPAHQDQLALFPHQSHNPPLSQQQLSTQRLSKWAESALCFCLFYLAEGGILDFSRKPAWQRAFSLQPIS
ncbi:hypothetical protein WR25_18337 [Diploscapter pachys]|uniref:Uncharacterized protein n=1 Tax=Diploscapter pachys TaxID=2018661 RepID=A0A2A2LXG7_9BILA|nr:hypothetical protein WR25_18337 [Diploscapter pachys]